MGRYVIRRLLQLIPVFFGTTFIIFAGVFLIPGDPIRALFGERPPPPALIQTLREQYNLNDPFLVQYGKYIWNVIWHRNLGTDFRQRPVLDIVVQAYPVTIKLALTAFAIEIAIGITAGVLAGLRRGGFFDNFVLLSTTLIISIPVFVLGFVTQLTLGVQLGLPFSFRAEDGWPLAYLLPALVLASLSLATLARLTRTSLVENLRADYVRTAIAKGLPRRTVVAKHTLRNSMIPVITLLGMDIGSLMGGAIVTEGIFSVPGIGRAVFQAITRQEGTVVVGISTLLVIVFLMANLIVDVLYGVLDPRIRYD